jgi:hypothetical protein
MVSRREFLVTTTAACAGTLLPRTAEAAGRSLPLAQQLPQPDLTPLGRDRFVQHVRSTFVVQAPTPVELTLTSVSERRVTAQFEGFSAYFHGPADRPLAQDTYTFVHPQMGSLSLFIVPIGQDTDGFVYQAVFTHLVAAPPPATL